jgi:hypothetical protein
MNFSKDQTEPKLGRYVQCIWVLEAENENDAYPRSLMIPDGIVGLIFHD